MINKMSVTVVLVMILVVYLSNADQLPISIHSISMNGELNPRYGLRTLYNSNPKIDTDLLVSNFETLDQDPECTSLVSSNITNQYIDQSQDVIGVLLEYFPSYENNCQYSDKGYLSILIASHPMAGYPRFPMLSYEEEFVIEGLTNYKLIQVPFVEYQNATVYHKYYVSFKVDQHYVFVETRAYEVNKGTIVETIPNMLDSIYRALSN